MNLSTFSWTRTWMTPAILGLDVAKINEIYDSSYKNVGDAELFSKFVLKFHNAVMIGFQLAFSFTIMGSLFYWSFLHDYL